MRKQTLRLVFSLGVWWMLLIFFAHIPVRAQNDLGSMEINALRLKAEAGDSAAQVEIGDRYYTGKGGVARDYTQSWAWYQKAASQGSAAAEDMIGISYLSGTGVKQDYAQARMWFQKAANAGYAPGQSNLGFSYERGLGGPQDITQARIWYRKAADQGYASAKQSLAALDITAPVPLPGAKSSIDPTAVASSDSKAAGGKAINSAPDRSDARASSPDIDVRFSKEDSRMLSSDEMAMLRDSVHWEPESSPVPYGGSSASYLIDKKGHKLGSIRVQWAKTTVPKGASSQTGAPAVGSFTVEIVNGTSCGFLGQAELDDPKGNVVVSSLDIDSWVGLGQPSSGKSIQVTGDAELPSSNPMLVLRPLSVGSALSACMTPRDP